MRYLVGLAVSVVASLLLANVGCAPPSTTKTEEPQPETKYGPKASVKETSQDGGTVDFSIPHEFNFKVANVGDEPLQLAVVKKSCLCTAVKLSAESIAPDKDGTVTLTWTPVPGGPPGLKAITCELATNDPKMPSIRLEIKGTIDPLVRLYPDETEDVDFYRLDQGRSSTREFKVFSTKLNDFKLSAKLTDTRGMKVKTTRLLDLDERTRYGDATPKSAYSVVVEARPDLPPGYYRADLLLTIQAKDQPARTITLPVHADVSNRVFSVIPSRVVFRKPLVREEDAVKAMVRFFNPSKQRTLRIVKCEPSFLKCELKETNSTSGTWLLTVRLPANSADAAKFQPDEYFEGSIVLQASDSDVQVPIRVKWDPHDPNKQ
jgi:hypothetical protein